MNQDSASRSAHIETTSSNSDQSSEYLRLTLGMLGRYRLQPNPVNFSLCYEYVAGANTALVAELDSLLAQAVASSATLKDEQARDLYQRFIWNADRQRLEAIYGQLRELVGEAITTMSQAEDQVSQQASTIAGHSQRLLESVSISEIKQIITALVADTRTLATNSSDLKAMLQDTRSEVEKLRSELEVARQQAVTDTLTGLSNRRAFESALMSMIQRAIEDHLALSMLIIDIDHFKQINDQHGHLVGDKALRSLANLLSANIKGKDLVARIGGEEFAILLSDTSSENARRVAENLRQLVEQTNFKRVDTGKSLGRLTISVGVATYRQREYYEEFWNRADQALYQSKQSGRNRVIVSAS